MGIRGTVLYTVSYSRTMKRTEHMEMEYKAVMKPLSYEACMKWRSMKRYEAHNRVFEATRSIKAS